MNRHWRVLGGLLASCVVIASCSGAPHASAVDRSICRTVRGGLVTLPSKIGAHAYALSEERHLLGSARLKGSPSNRGAVVFVNIGFIADLTRSHDSTFHSLGEALQRSNTGPSTLMGQLEAGCSTLGL